MQLISIIAFTATMAGVFATLIADTQDISCKWIYTVLILSILSSRRNTMVQNLLTIWNELEIRALAQSSTIQAATKLVANSTVPASMFKVLNYLGLARERQLINKCNHSVL